MTSFLLGETRGPGAGAGWDLGRRGSRGRASPIVLPPSSVLRRWGAGPGPLRVRDRFPPQAQTLRPESLLLVSTLDGSLHALSKQTGDLKWTLRDGEQGGHRSAPELEWCQRVIEGEDKGSGIPQARSAGGFSA